MIRSNAFAALILTALIIIVGARTGGAQSLRDESQGRVLSEVEMLLAGAEANRLDVVVYLLNKGVDPNTTADNGYTALIVAASNGRTEIIDLLLARGADVNQANKTGWTPLMEAAMRDQDRTVQQLLKAGAKVNVVEMRNGQTPLIVAAKSDRPDSVTTLLAAGADVKAADTKRGLTALHHALSSTKHRSTEMVAELLVAGADPERRAKDGYTPLMSAVDSGEVAKVSLVLSESVSIDAETNDGRTALVIAAGGEHPAPVRRLLKAGAKVEGGSGKFTPLTQAVRAGLHETTRLLLEAGADPNRSAMDGRRPLMLAARAGQDEIVRLLLDKGASVDGRNETDGTTALMWAANNGLKSIVEFLIERGANPGLSANDGWTAGEAARMAGHADIAKKLDRRI
ncbi:MAG: ankyrin repeat domain-containing protein [Hyphomicrobiaceae bacterium]|nr:ankyrin repeat domain-containing protein [Hyphomicrobiaceae bacterium]